MLVAGGVLTSLLTLVAISRVWNRAFWRPPAQSPAEDTAGAAAADAGPERVRPAAVAGRTHRRADAPRRCGGRRPAAAGRAPAAWQRHTAVATATAPATDGLGDDGRAGSGPLRPLPRVMVGATAAMVVVTVALTGVAGPLYGVADRAADGPARPDALHHRRLRRGRTCRERTLDADAVHGGLGHRLRHQFPLLVWLVLVWILLWGTWSWANLICGVARRARR